MPAYAGKTPSFIIKIIIFIKELFVVPYNLQKFCLLNFKIFILIAVKLKINLFNKIKLVLKFLMF